MPLVRIELLGEGESEDRARAVGDAVHRAMVEHLDVPERDRFQVIGEHAPGRLVYAPRYLGVERTDGFVFVQVFLSAGRTTDQKWRSTPASPSCSREARRGCGPRTWPSAWSRTRGRTGR